MEVTRAINVGCHYGQVANDLGQSSQKPFHCCLPDGTLSQINTLAAELAVYIFLLNCDTDFEEMQSGLNEQ